MKSAESFCKQWKIPSNLTKPNTLMDMSICFMELLVFLWSENVTENYYRVIFTKLKGYLTIGLSVSC